MLLNLLKVFNFLQKYLYHTCVVCMSVCLYATCASKEDRVGHQLSLDVELGGREATYMDVELQSFARTANVL